MQVQSTLLKKYVSFSLPPLVSGTQLRIVCSSKAFLQGDNPFAITSEPEKYEIAVCAFYSRLPSSASWQSIVETAVKKVQCLIFNAPLPLHCSVKTALVTKYNQLINSTFPYMVFIGPSVVTFNIRISKMVLKVCGVVNQTVFSALQPKQTVCACLPLYLTRKWYFSTKMETLLTLELSLMMKPGTIRCSMANGSLLSRTV